MRVNIDQTPPNFYFQYLQSYYRRNITPVIGDKFAEFMKLNEKYPHNEMPRREAAYINLMMQHINELAESNIRWKTEAEQMVALAENFHKTMSHRFHQHVLEVKTTIGRFHDFVSIFGSVSNEEELVKAMAENSRVW